MTSRVFITGSTDGIGLAAAKLLTQQGHKVTLHARSQDRAAQAKAALPEVEGVLIGDLTSLESIKSLAAEANKAGPWSAVVHNAGVGLSGTEGETGDGLAKTFQVNSLAPYVLTALMEKPKKLLYVSSSLHLSGDPSLKDVNWKERSFVPMQAYNDSKLHNVLLANAVARHWPDVQSCSYDPGWVKTKLGGGSAPGSSATSAEGIAAYINGKSGAGDRSGVYFNVSGAQSPQKAATEEAKQEELLAIYSKFSGISLPK
ncbi:unnamed protein product [Zymoseptoria tritici ST99CH_1A5]|uniref:Short chain dehydrogenase n=4 Tax=Zymoseptoria tritici TaxID=1047171 RepID=F9X9Q5_ZYMTI|nr:uncharacterized protein MYCGRDRAFT_71358 [Zymoseptoria tritici IPO323]SMQ50121.1 unnamed protein product [Zymoseptoria tritici ST99CH_3D7]SMR51099.1 unnamed protein product [Zymoseptoria tritici ST99CH_1E4]SMR52038.1 unnamed protein product [Zymoseptoria tritici ST99CH_3D1]SMY23793.1 unnamed protein product [Zymoseptoria tritici ST99CH_1A5]EGP88309.1 hypothetical protein MYCGRDRAFT_71358 [Zymoseptoria tritici IPO323]